MILTVARQEIRSQFRDGRVRWSGLAVLLLLMFSVVTGLEAHHRAVSERDEVQQTMWQQWLEQGEKNPHSAAHFSIYAFKPRLPVAFFDGGIEPYVGSAIWLEAHYQNEAVYSPARDATSLSRFGQLTAATTLQLLIPLLIIVMGAGLFAGEREDGTLRFLASLGIPSRTLAAGKALGLCFVLAALLIPATLMGAMALLLYGGAYESAGANLRAFGIAGVHVVYFGMFVFLTLAVSTLATERRPALLVLLTVWAMNGLVAQRVVPLVAEQLHPLPTWHSFQAAIAEDKRDGIDGHNPTGERAAELERQLLEEYNVDSVDELPIDFSGVALQADEEHGAIVYDRHYGALHDILQAQDRVHLLAGVLSPALALRDVSMALAGTDGAHHAHFAAAAEDYRRDLVRRLNEAIIYSEPGPYESNVGGRELWESMPRFVYQPPSAGWAYSRQTGRFAVLGGWLVLLIGLAGVAASRYRLVVKDR